MILSTFRKHRDLFPVLGEVDAWLVAEVKDMMLHAACGKHLST